MTEELFVKLANFAVVAALIGILYRLVQDDLTRLRNEKVDQRVCVERHLHLEELLSEIKATLKALNEKIDKWEE
jgi:hypothetical protein